MKYNFILLFLLNLNVQLFAQTGKIDSTINTSSHKTDTAKMVWIGFGANRAESDIKNGYIRILMSSGLILHLLDGDQDFEKKYKLKFYNECIYISKKSIYEYNTVVFNYLDAVFGKEWRKEIRKDVIGL